MTTGRINARLDAEARRKLAYVQRETGKTATMILKESLALYYESLDARATPFAILSDSGFIGCGDGPGKPASRHKPELTGALERKDGDKR